MSEYGDMKAIYNVESRAMGHKEYVSTQNYDVQNLFNVKSGDKIHGEVIAMDDKLTIRIAGQDIVADRDMNPSARIGDTMEFEVLRQGGQQVVLKANTSKDRENKILLMTKRQENDQEVFLSRKEYSSKQAEKELSIKQQKQSIQLILSTMTAKDYSLLEGTGFDPNNMTIMGMIEELSHQQEEIAPEYAPVKDREIDIDYIKQRMKLYNLPEIEEMARKMLAALGLSKTIGDITKETVREILHRNQEPTIENLYKAQFTRNSKVAEEMTEEAWNTLKPQVETVIEQAGYEVNETTLRRAKWMIHEEIPLTADNVERCNQLFDCKKQDQNQTLDDIIGTVKEGKKAEETWLIPNDRQKTREWLEKVHDIDEDAVKEAIEKQMPITIESFLHTREQQKKELTVIGKPLTSEQEYESLKAIRQLEEIRLKMTVDAALRLEKKGFHVETKALEEVVNELRSMEESYYQEQFHQIELDANTDQINLLRQTTDRFEMLKSIPSFVLGQTLEQRQQITASSLLDVGRSVAVELQKASTAYETLMTRPMGEYGDSIQKAFSNVGSLLDELGLDKNTYNQRAVRILGYNQMEISVESIEEMKAYDRMVNSLLQNIHPAVTVRLIRDGVNPLEMPLEELEEKVLEMKEAEGIDKEERFSSYLHRLEKDHGITEEERKAYIGIYRLIHQINQSDGAALGAVIKAEQGITLGHMLTAIRTMKKGSMDTLVDDAFGVLEKITLDENSISNQINSIKGSNSGKSEKLTSHEENKMDVHRAVFKQMEHTITPQILNQIVQSSEESMESKNDVWNQIKNMPVEELQDQIDQVIAENHTMASVNEDRLQELKQILKYSNQGLRFLEELKLPCTVGNLYYAEQILSHESPFYRSYQKLMDPENNFIKQFTDALLDQESMESILDEMEEKIDFNQKEATISMETESMSHRSIAELKQLGQQLLFMKSLAKKEFYQIPVETDRGITTINLTLIRSGESTGNIKITMNHPMLGDVKAEFTIKGKEVLGNLSVDTRESYDRLKLEQSTMKSSLESKGFVIKHYEICLGTAGKDTALMVMRDTEGIPKANDQELYGFAKQMVQILQEIKA